MDDEVKGEGNSVNYKFRMHDPRLGRFFAIDPLANDYPFYSPYSFSGNIVINAIELEGLEPIYVAGTTQDIPRPTKPLLVSSTQREIEFAITNLFTALAIGLANGSTNISSNSSRFATRGVDAKSGSILNLNLSLRDKKNPKGIDQGGQIGAFRHVLWQSTIRNEFGYKIAKQVGDAHENNPNVDLNKRNFKSNEIALADQTTDLLNNQIGREIGRLNPDATTNELAQATATYFYEKGFYTFNKDKDGNITIVRSKITRKQYELLIARFKELNNNGETLGESTLREQNSKDKLVK